MIERLNEILTEKTISVEVKCLVNQSVLDKNFKVIIDCLKDLENKQVNMQNQMNHLVDKNNHFQKELENAKTNTHIGLSQDNIKGDQLDKVSISSKGSKQKQNNLSNEDEIRQLIKQLQNQVNRDSEINKKNNLENIKDINIILKDIKELKERIDALQSFNKNNEQKEQSDPNSSQSELLQQNIRTLQNQLHRHSEKLDKLQSEIDKVKNKNSNIMEKIKGIENNSGNGSTGHNLDDENSQNQLDSLRNQFEKLKNQVDKNQNKQREDVRDLTKRWENMDLSVKELEQRNKNNQINIEDILNRLDGLGGNNSNNNNNNSDNIGDKDKLRLEKQIRRLEDMIKKDNRGNDEWKRRIDENIKEHTLNIVDLQNLIANLQNILGGMQKQRVNTSMKDLNDGQRSAGQRLPSISGKKGLRLKNSKQQSSKNINDLDNKLQEFKSDLQNWVRQLLDTRNIGGQDTNSKRKEEAIDGIELKIQEIKLILERKADQQGVKKYLSFLDNKINQIWSIISQPDTEDALIARKGWNCLSCAKKLEKYRGKIGEHINWNNMTTTNYSPPRINQTVSYNNTSQNFNHQQVPKSRQFGNQPDSRSKQFP